MLRPLAVTQSRKPRASRFAALAATGAIEIALVGALLSGLAAHVVKDLPHELAMVDLTEPTTPPETIPPVKPELVKPEMPTVPIPVIRIQRPVTHNTITAVATPKPIMAPPAPVVLPLAPEPLAIASTGLKSIAATHTTPPYPEMARRLGEQGNVQLHIAVDANGRVTAVSVSKSSGSEKLDEAARSWILSNWRYHAATQNGAGVASETEALVVFDLKNARG